MMSKKKALLLCTLFGAAQAECASSSMARGMALIAGGLGVAAAGAALYEIGTDSRRLALAKLKAGKCTLSFTSDLMVCDEDPILVRDKNAEDVDARFVYDDFSHYHKIDDTLKKRPVKNLVLCSESGWRRCVTLDCIKTREALEQLLEESGMQFDPKAKDFPYVLASWQTSMTPDEALKASRIQESKEHFDTQKCAK